MTIREGLVRCQTRRGSRSRVRPESCVRILNHHPVGLPASADLGYHAWAPSASAVKRMAGRFPRAVTSRIGSGPSICEAAGVCYLIAQHSARFEVAVEVVRSVLRAPNLSCQEHRTCAVAARRLDVVLSCAARSAAICGERHAFPVVGRTGFTGRPVGSSGRAVGRGWESGRLMVRPIWRV